MKALSHDYWMQAVAAFPKTEREQELATMLLGVMEAAADHPGVAEYLTRRAREAME